MDVGHSFPVKKEKRHSVTTLAKKYGEGQEPIWKFTVRIDEKGKLRCWRVE